MVVSSIIAGASGGALANVALSPLGGGAGMLQSYWYGAGLILGERDMYTFHWEKIKKRLEGGEDYLSVLESEMNPAITAIANYSLQIMQKTGSIYMQGGIDFMAKLIENMFKLLAGEKPDVDIPFIKIDEPVPVPTTPQCPSGFRWSASAQQCVPEDIPEPTPTSEPVFGINYEKRLTNPELYASGKSGMQSTSGGSKNALYSNIQVHLGTVKWVVVTTASTLEQIKNAGDSAWQSPTYRKIWKNSKYYWLLT